MSRLTVRIDELSIRLGGIILKMHVDGKIFSSVHFVVSRLMNSRNLGELRNKMVEAKLISEATPVGTARPSQMIPPLAHSGVLPRADSIAGRIATARGERPPASPIALPSGRTGQLSQSKLGVSSSDPELSLLKQSRGKESGTLGLAGSSAISARRY